MEIEAGLAPTLQEEAVAHAGLHESIAALVEAGQEGSDLLKGRDGPRSCRSPFGGEARDGGAADVIKLDNCGGQGAEGLGFGREGFGPRRQVGDERDPRTHLRGGGCSG